MYSQAQIDIFISNLLSISFKTERAWRTCEVEISDFHSQHANSMEGEKQLLLAHIQPEGVLSGSDPTGPNLLLLLIVLDLVCHLSLVCL